MRVRVSVRHVILIGGEVVLIDTREFATDCEFSSILIVFNCRMRMRRTGYD